MAKQQAILKNWKVVTSYPTDPSSGSVRCGRPCASWCASPTPCTTFVTDDGAVRLSGDVLDQPRFLDGMRITTSPILRTWCLGGVRFAETHNTIYRLIYPRS